MVSGRSDWGPDSCPFRRRSPPLRYRVDMESIAPAGKPSKNAADEAEAVRLHRLREDARRPMSVNLAETIALSHALLKMADAARRQ